MNSLPVLRSKSWTKWWWWEEEEERRRRRGRRWSWRSSSSWSRWYSSSLWSLFVYLQFSSHDSQLLLLLLLDPPPVPSVYLFLHLLYFSFWVISRNPSTKRRRRLIWAEMMSAVVSSSSFLTAALFSCFCFPDSWFSRIDCFSVSTFDSSVLFFIWFWFILLEPKRDESFFFAINKSAWLWSKIKKQTWLTQVKPVCLPLRLHSWFSVLCFCNEFRVWSITVQTFTRSKPSSFSLSWWGNTSEGSLFLDFGLGKRDERKEPGMEREKEMCVI